MIKKPGRTSCKGKGKKPKKKHPWRDSPNIPIRSNQSLMAFKNECIEGSLRRLKFRGSSKMIKFPGKKD